MIRNGIFVLIIIILSACGVPKHAVVTPELHNRFIEDLKAGNLNLTCESVECTFSWIDKYDEMVSLYKSAQWTGLTDLVMQVGFPRDLAYYFLGRSAEGLGYSDSAMKYYQKSMSLYSDSVHSHHCREFQQGCGGVDLASVLPQRIASIQALAAKNNSKNDGDISGRTLANSQLSQAQSRSTGTLQADTGKKNAAKSGGALPLKHGIYVEKGGNCPDADNIMLSESLTYRSEPSRDKRGNEIKGKYKSYFEENSNNYYCPIVSVKHNDNIYKVKLKCMTGVGAYSMGNEDWTIRIISETSFAIVDGKMETIYEFCF